MDIRKEAGQFILPHGIIVTPAAAMSRLWGGIHFRDAIDHGITQGSKIGDWVIGKFEKTTDGGVAMQKSLIQNHY